MKNTDYSEYIKSELKELETRDPDLLTTLICESLVEMNGQHDDVLEDEIYNFILKLLKGGEK